MDQSRLFLPAIDSALPAPARHWLRSVRRGVLRDLDDSDVDAPGVSWVVGGVAIALVSMVVFLAVVLIGWGWGIAAALVLPLLAGSAACFVTAQRRVRRAKRILTHHVIQASSQASLAQRHPLLGARLERATSVILELHRLRRDQALAGVLDIDEDLVDRLHYEMVSLLLAGDQLATSVAAAAEFPELAGRVAARRAELAALEEAADARLAEATNLAAAAAAVAQARQRAERVSELAQQLDSHPTPAAAAGLVPLADDDLAAKVATARAALELLTSR